MGFTHQTYIAYGVHIPVDGKPIHSEVDRLEDTDLPDGVRYLTAGGWDGDMLFLTTACYTVKPGDYRLAPVCVAEEVTWDRQLYAAIHQMGFIGTNSPGWLIIPDVS